MLFVSPLCSRALPIGWSSRRQPGGLKVGSLPYLQLGVSAEPAATVYADEEFGRLGLVKTRPVLIGEVFLALHLLCTLPCLFP